jgi:hypothetical protein
VRTSFGAIAVAPLLIEMVPLDEALPAFDPAGARPRAMQMILAL